MPELGQVPGDGLPHPAQHRHRQVGQLAAAGAPGRGPGTGSSVPAGRHSMENRYG